MKSIREYSDMQCPMDGILKMLMGPWTTYILWLLRQHGELRFGEIKKQMPGISAKMLTERLRMLEEVGIVTRHHEPTIPPKVSYRFTTRGEDLTEVLDKLAELAMRWDCPGTEKHKEKIAKEKAKKSASEAA